MTFHIITLFPECLQSYVQASVLGRALKNGIIKITYYNPRDFGEGKWNKTDGKPYGGGPGMVLLPGPVLRAVKKAVGRKKKAKIIFFTPGGKEFTNRYATDMSKRHKDIILICGRYEGIDARVKKILKADEISIGNYVVTGGELPALVFMDALSRQIPGVLGKFESVEENRISSHEVYTRPPELVWKGKKYCVPKVLLSGNHKEIDAWKEKRTKKGK